MQVSNYGAIILSIMVPDRDGVLADVVLGYRNIEDYLDQPDHPYFGAVIGRYANRINLGQIIVDGQSHGLNKKGDLHLLHGGAVGFDRATWSVVESNPAAITLALDSPDGDQGFPGNLHVEVTYTLTDENVIRIDYLATTDQPTPINLTQHSYFNLKGEGKGTILDHHVMIDADSFTPINDVLIPTGEISEVAGTPLDFRSSKPLSDGIDSSHAQIKRGLGFDHNFVINRPEGDQSLVLAARVNEPTTGRMMEVHTTMPGMQLYSGNYLDGQLVGKSGRRYEHRSGLCLETQYFPDSPNQPNFPGTILRPGTTWTSQTEYRFGNDRGVDSA